MTYQCRLCNQSDVRVSLLLPKSARNIQRLLSESELKNDKSIDLVVMQCERCGFVQLPPVLDDDYYDDYLMGTTHSLQMQNYQSRQAVDFVDRFNLQGALILEAGCGDGSFSEHLKKSGARVIGVEPSQRFRGLAIERGINTIDGYVSAARVFKEGPFDAFVTRQVLEHVPNIHDFLSGIRKNIKDGGSGLIEVPSLEKAIRDCRYYDFFADHVNYFSLATLALALEMNGFEVIECHHDMHDEYNVALVKAIPIPNLDGIQSCASKLGSELRNFIDTQHAKDGKVAIWGAGGKGLSVLASADIDNIDLMVDSDPFKQGLFNL